MDWKLAKDIKVGDQPTNCAPVTEVVEVRIDESDREPHRIVLFTDNPDNCVVFRPDDKVYLEPSE